MTKSYLESVRHQLEYYKALGEKTFAQLSDEQLFWQYDPQSNSIATIVKHLSGNMISRWTDFFTTDGEKENRNRESEFDNDLRSRTELLRCWDAGWKCFLAVIYDLKEADLAREIFIRHEALSVTEAVNRQLAHYPYHIGQIVFIGKMLCSENWTSLSIPRGGSSAFNQVKEKQSKTR